MTCGAARQPLGEVLDGIGPASRVDDHGRDALSLLFALRCRNGNSILGLRPRMQVVDKHFVKTNSNNGRSE